MCTAPWSNITENASANPSNTPLTLTEIQKAERERRAELYRLEQAQQQNQAILDQQQHKESVLKWKLNPQNQAKSLTEIQAEESKARQQTTLLIAANVSVSLLLNLFNSFAKKKSIQISLVFIGIVASPAKQTKC